MGLAQDVLVVAGLAGVAIAGLFFIIRGAGQAFEGFKFPEITLPSLPSITLPTFEFPTFELPTFELPSFEFPTFELPSFEFPTFELPTFEDIFPRSGNGGDFTDVGMAGARGERGGTGDEPQVLLDDLINVGLPDIPFAVTNIEETQAGFQQRSAALAELLPDLTRSTSLPDGDIIFGRQLSRESEDFESVLEAEARRSESIFTGLFGNVQNPEFGA